MLRTGVKQAAM